VVCIKAQISSTIVLYVLLIIIVSVVVVLGYFSITRMSERGGQAVMMNLKMGLAADIKDLARDYGTVKEKRYSVPGNVQEICFVDKGNDEKFPGSQQWPDPRFLDNNLAIRNTIGASPKETPYNLFVLTDSGFDSEHVAKLRLNGYFVQCFNASAGVINLKLTGKGSDTLIEAMG